VRGLAPYKKKLIGKNLTSIVNKIKKKIKIK